MGSGMPNPFKKTAMQNKVSPAAMSKEGPQRNSLLAKALTKTRTGRAMTKPAPRTSRPNRTVETTTKVNPLNVNPPIGVPVFRKERIREMDPIIIRRPPRIVGK